MRIGRQKRSDVFRLAFQARARAICEELKSLASLCSLCKALLGFLDLWFLVVSLADIFSRVSVVLKLSVPTWMVAGGSMSMALE